MGKGRGQGARPRGPADKDAARKGYSIEYSPDALDHLAGLSTSHQRLVVDGVSEQLKHEPSLETRNRKRLRTNPIAPWELRLGDLRVYYDMSAGADRIVYVRAVGVKEHNGLRIGREVIEL